MMNKAMANSKKEKTFDPYEGAMILVSRVPNFVKHIRFDETLDMKKQ